MSTTHYLFVAAVKAALNLKLIVQIYKYKLKSWINKV